MTFDPSTAQEIGWEYSFDPSTAKAVEEFDPATALPAHDWGTTDARDVGKTNPGMSAPERKGTSWERIKLSAEEGYAVNPTTGRNAGVEKLKTAQNMLKDIERDPFKTDAYLPHIEKLQKEGTKELQQYLTLRRGLDEELRDKNPAMWERILGGAAGQITDPLNLLGVGNGKSVWGTLLKQFSLGAGVGVFGALEQGDYDKAIGLIDKDPTFQELIDAGLTTGTIAAVLSGILHVAGRPPKAKGPGLDPTEAEAKAYVEKIIPPSQDVDVSGAQAPQYLGRGSQTQIKNEMRASDYAASHGIDYEPATKNLGLEDARGRWEPNFFDLSELAEAEKKANRAAQAKSNLPQAVDVMTGIPDVRDGNIQTPYMTPDEVARAQAQVEKTGEPSHSYMEIPEEARYEPYWPDKDLEAAKTKANFVADLNEKQFDPNKPSSVKKAATDGGAEKATGTEERNPALSAALRKAKNLGEALDAIRPYVDDSTKSIYNKLLKVADPLTKYHVFEWFPEFRRASLEDAAGVFRTLEDGRTDIQIRGDSYKVHGLDVETTLHEAVHSVTDAAFRIADSELINKPEFKAHRSYVKDITALWKAIQDQMQRDVNKTGKPKTLYGKEATAWAESFGREGKMPKDASEFNSYAWTNPEFRALLKEIKLDRYKKSAWELVKDAFKRLLGREVKTKNALKEIDSFINRLDEIQGVSDADRAKALNGEFSTRNIKASEIAKGVTEQYAKAADLIEAFKDKVSDIPFSKKLLPVTLNQAGEWFKHPYLEWTYNRLRRIDNDIDIRANYNKAYLKDVIDLLKNRKKDALRMIKVLVDIQDPELKAGRQQAEDTNTREQFLTEHGMPESLVPHTIKILNVMKATGLHDQNTAYEFRGHNFRMEPMYFPKEHTGPFTVYVMSADGSEVLHAQPFDHMKGARIYEKALKDAVRKNGGDSVVSLERNDAGRTGDIYSMLNLSTDNLPDFLKQINDNLLKEIELRKRKFEMERSAKNITGATGSLIYNSSNPLSWRHSQDQRTLSLIQRRLEQSYALERAKRVIKEIKEPFLETPDGMKDKDGVFMPELANYLHQIIADNLGLDIGKVQQAQKALIDKPIKEFGKAIDKIAGDVHGYKGGDISYFKPNEMSRMLQAYVWFMSVAKLGWSAPVLAANATTAMLPPIDGFRTASREGIPTQIAALAGMKTLVAPFDDGVHAFLKQANLEGMVEPRISDPMTFVRTHARSQLDTALNLPRDMIEKATNLSALSYYYNFYSLAYPELNPLSDAFKTKVYKAARSLTGDYTQEAQPLIFRQAGYAGQAMSNFAKWKYNQLGRLLNDIQSLKEGNVMPFAVTMGMATLLAGALGAPIIAEYEALRRLLYNLSGGSIDWKPFAEFYYDSKEWAKKHLGTKASTTMDVLERGPINYAASIANPAAPDLSGSLRHSSIADVSVLPFTFAGDTYKGIDALLKLLWGLAVRESPTHEEFKAIAKAMPVVLGRPVNEMVENRIQTGDWFKPGYVKQFSSQDAGAYRRTPEEKVMANLGFSSLKQNQYMDRIYGKEWNDRRVKTMISSEIKRMTANLNYPNVLQDAAKKIFEESGIDGVNAAIAAIEKKKQDVNTSYLERELLKSTNISDPIARAKLLEALRKFQPEG